MLEISWKLRQTPLCRLWGRSPPIKAESRKQTITINYIQALKCRWTSGSGRTGQTLAHWHFVSRTVFIQSSAAVLWLTSNMTDEQEAWSPWAAAEECSVRFCFTLCEKMELFSLHTFESVHDVLVVSHLRVLTLSVVFPALGTFLTWLPAPAGGWREGLSWKQATWMGHCAGSSTCCEKLSLITVPMSWFPVCY